MEFLGNDAELLAALRDAVRWHEKNFDMHDPQWCGMIRAGESEISAYRCTAKWSNGQECGAMISPFLLAFGSEAKHERYKGTPEPI